MSRNRKWLQSIVNLGAEQDLVDGITKKEVKRQEDTVLRALEMIDSQPGVVLADEVGMGKTFEALGIIACFRRLKPRQKIIVITPGPDLNRHWIQAVNRFRENNFYPFKKNEYREVNRLKYFPEAVKKYPIIFVPVSIFSSGRNKAEHEFLLNAYFRWARLRTSTRRNICKRFFNSVKAVKDVTRLKFMGRYSFRDLKKYIENAFQRSSRNDKGYAGLHDLYSEGGAEVFDIKKHRRTLYRALDRARFHFLNKILPVFGLLVVDEAHKLKNPWSLRSQAVSNILYRRYQKTLFLTATPFQLGIHELEQVFNIFSHALGAPKNFKQQFTGFIADIKEYQKAYADFENNWADVDSETAGIFAEWYKNNPSLSKEHDDPVLCRLAADIRLLKKLKKSKIEPGFRKLMIRSLKEEAHEYRDHKKRLLPTPRNGLIPFLIYERMLLEIYRQRRSTYKATVEINMTSSFQAALEGTLLLRQDPVQEVEGYRKLLNYILRREADAMGHPKINDVVKDTIKAMKKGEKTLVFCERNATIKSLRQKISELWDKEMLLRWQKLFPGSSREEIWGRYDERGVSKGRQTNLQTRFRKSQDTLYLALRENYIYTILDLPEKIFKDAEAILSISNRILKQTLTGSSSAKRVDYRLIKRCVEQAIFQLLMDRQPAIYHRLKKSQHYAGLALKDITLKEYPQLGIDVELGEEEGDEIGSFKPNWSITRKTLKSVLSQNRKGIWYPFREKLNQFDLDSRVRLVEGIASFLTRREVAFLVDLLDQVNARGGNITSSLDIRNTLELWWRKPKNLWRKKIGEFLDYFSSLNPSRRSFILEDALKTGKLVSDTLVPETRERIKEAFNTPFYPIILIGNRVMQEGLDLHRNCRRIVHHDLSWNPAQLEQRVGRIDRIGSLTSRERDRGKKDYYLEILYPLVERSIDIRQFQVVKEREKWLNFLLGTPPDNFDRYSLSETPSSSLPEELAKTLTVKLQPT